MTGAPKFKNKSRDLDHAPVRNNLSSAGWDLLSSSMYKIWNLYLPSYENMLFCSVLLAVLDPRVGKAICKAVENVQNAVF